MALRQNPSLSEIMAKFKEAQAHEKRAEAEVDPQQMAMLAQQQGMVDPQQMDMVDPNMLAQQGAVDPAMLAQQGVPPQGEMPMPPEQPEQVTQDDLMAAVQALSGAAEKSDALAGASDQAAQEVVQTGEALKQVADEFINEHTAALADEATLFGQIFAASCMEEMQKTAELNEMAEEAFYNANALLDGGNMRFLEKQAAYEALMKQAAYEEAYKDTMAKLAGFKCAEEVEDIVGREVSPEEMAELAEAVQSDDDNEVDNIIDDLSDEELEELAQRIDEEEDDRDLDTAESAEAILDADADDDDIGGYDVDDYNTGDYDDEDSLAAADAAAALLEQDDE